MPVLFKFFFHYLPVHWPLKTVFPYSQYPQTYKNGSSSSSVSLGIWHILSCLWVIWNSGYSLYPSNGEGLDSVWLYFFLFFIYFFNFKIFNSYMHSQTWTPLPPPSPYVFLILHFIYFRGHIERFKSDGLHFTGENRNSQF